MGDATAWYLIRNLYGGPFFKPDVHIREIADHFFGDRDAPLAAMREESMRLWPPVCQDPRLLPLHIGELDYILWWYKRKNKLPGKADDAA